MAQSPTWLFCKIAAGQIPAKKVYEDDEIVAFHDIHPWAPVHILLVPKEHIVSMADVTDAHAGLLGPTHAARRHRSLQRGQQPQPGHRCRHGRDLEHRQAQPRLERRVHFVRARETEHCRDSDRARVTEQRLDARYRARAHFAGLECASQVRRIQLGHGFVAREFDLPVAQPRPTPTERRGDLSRAEFAQPTEIQQQAGRPLLQHLNARDHRLRHAVCGLDRADGREQLAVALAQWSIRKPGAAQSRNERLEGVADRRGSEPRQRVIRLVPD